MFRRGVRRPRSAWNTSGVPRFGRTWSRARAAAATRSGDVGRGAVGRASVAARSQECGDDAELCVNERGVIGGRRKAALENRAGKKEGSGRAGAQTSAAGGAQRGRRTRAQGRLQACGKRVHNRDPPEPCARTMYLAPG